MTAVELEFLNMLYDYCFNPHLTEVKEREGLWLNRIWKKEDIL